MGLLILQFSSKPLPMAATNTVPIRIGILEPGEPASGLGGKHESFARQIQNRLGQDALHYTTYNLEKTRFRPIPEMQLYGSLQGRHVPFTKIIHGWSPYCNSYAIATQPVRRCLASVLAIRPWHKRLADARMR